MSCHHDASHFHRIQSDLSAMARPDHLQADCTRRPAPPYSTNLVVSPSSRNHSVFRCPSSSLSCWTYEDDWRISRWPIIVKITSCRLHSDGCAFLVRLYCALTIEASTRPLLSI
ncbi:unnamed protein product [Protopolystoma xenopodis]|uniref:Uncharacterized protein n=1 Tax=Protopolystoma xenopodis TaxID=117903 RepID=A0A448XCD4_9PLAT|nr:unnamed protein product [Protopolystoma xenopodis]